MPEDGTGYRRVLPRDLFNEASLLKCYGRLVIALEEKGLSVRATLAETVKSFEILMRSSDGFLFVNNLPLTVGDRAFRLVRPLNSRGAWPLYAEAIGDPNFESVDVFDDHGDLSPEMLAVIQGSWTVSA
jgi:hypothetical protein